MQKFSGEGDTPSPPQIPPPRRLDRRAYIYTALKLNVTPPKNTSYGLGTSFCIFSVSISMSWTVLVQVIVEDVVTCFWTHCSR